jgi:hypothetical protein
VKDGDYREIVLEILLFIVCAFFSLTQEIGLEAENEILE